VQASWSVEGYSASHRACSPRWARMHRLAAITPRRSESAPRRPSRQRGRLDCYRDGVGDAPPAGSVGVSRLDDVSSRRLL